MYEDLAHIIFECPFAIQIWRASGMWHSVEKAVRDTETAEQQQQQQLFFSSYNSYCRPMRLIEDWTAANSAGPTPGSAEMSGEIGREYNVQQRCSRSDSCSGGKDCSKATICAISTHLSLGNWTLGIGMCIRDEGGTFVLARNIWFSPVFNFDLGEALGLYHPIQWIHDLHLDNNCLFSWFEEACGLFHQGKKPCNWIWFCFCILGV